jgi:hypothetical protein
MSAHLPAGLPLQARLKPTISRIGSRIIAAEHNRIARRVVEYLHARILKDRRKHQSYSHQEVGAALGIEPRQVGASLAHAGTSITTVVVTEADRAAIKKLRKELEMMAR